MRRYFRHDAADYAIFTPLLMRHAPRAADFTLRHAEMPLPPRRLIHMMPSFLFFDIIER